MEACSCLLSRPLGGAANFTHEPLAGQHSIWTGRRHGLEAHVSAFLRQQRHSRYWGLWLAKARANSPGEPVVRLLSQRLKPSLSAPPPFSSKRHTEQPPRLRGFVPLLLTLARGWGQSARAAHSWDSEESSRRVTKQWSPTP